MKMTMVETEPQMKSVLFLAVGLLVSPAAVAQPAAQPLFQSGVDNLKNSKFEDAAASFRKVVELEPGNVRGVRGVALTFYAEKKADAAIQFLQSETAKNPSSPELHIVLGDMAVTAGHNDLAIAEFKAALPLADNKPELYVPRGSPQGALVLPAADANPVTEAVRLLNGIDTTPKGPAGIHLRLAEVLRLKDDHPGSAAEWQKTADLIPKSSPILTGLAMELEASGKRKEAVAAYRESLTITRNDPLVLNNLAYLLAETGGDLYEALRYARLANTLVPGLPEIMDTTGWVALKQGFVDDAVGTFLRVVDKQPENALYRKHLAQAITQSGVHSPASDELIRALLRPPVPGDGVKIQAMIRSLTTESVEGRQKTSK